MTTREDEPSTDAATRIVFQPIVDLDAWSVVGFEALARFSDGTPPPVRLAEAEAAGTRAALELDLIGRAVAASAALPAGGFVTINASGTTILRDEIDGLLAGLDRPWGLELYEAETPADLREIRRRVSAIGGHLLVDDAGAAGADAHRISTLRPDVVKIDRALFWELADPAARARLAPLADAAREAGAALLVEGVSDPEHVELAREIGARYAQGYHLGMPTAAADLPALLSGLQRSIGVDAPGLRPA